MFLTSREWSSLSEYAIIRGSSDDEDDEDEYLEEQLEDALDDRLQYIIIEPEKIGNETTKWIQIGNFLHKNGVLSGLGSVIISITFPKRYRNYFYIPVGIISLACISLYNISWQYDPCCKYQVEYDTRTLEKLEIDNLRSSVVVLKRRDDTYRKRLHNIVGTIVVCLFAWKIYKFYS